MPRRLLLLGMALVAQAAGGLALTPDRLGVVYNRNDASSAHIAQYYAARRNVPLVNLVGLSLPARAVIDRETLRRLRAQLVLELPSRVQSLLLIWSRPYAVECMSITTAMAAGYQSGFCEPGCGNTIGNPLFDTQDWLPADSIGWLPAMLLPSDDEALAEAVIDRGILADDTHPDGTVYLVRTQDAARNVRVATYPDVEAAMSGRVLVRQLSTPIRAPVTGIIAYFTGTAHVEELPLLAFRPGAAADHLTSVGGILDFSGQMSALEWLKSGATGSYGSVSEPCNVIAKFPNSGVFLTHYLHGDSLLEAYWKSVVMPGQGLFIGEPLARPYAVRD